MKKYFFCFLISSVPFLTCFAQLISTKPIDVTVGTLNFNADFIKKNKIKTIILSMTDKPDGAVIVDKGAMQSYEFDKNGKTIRYYYTVLNRIVKEEIEESVSKKKGHYVTTRSSFKYINDTVFMNVFYDSLNRIIVKRINTGDYYDATYYEYNEESQIKKEIHCKETNASGNKTYFILGVQNTVSSEIFVYTKLTATQIKKSCLNDENREYKKAIINYDEKGNKISENYDFLVSWMRQENTYQYDNAGLLHQRTNTRNESGVVKDYSIFWYDAKGALLTENKFKNGELTDEINYLYDDSKTFIKSEVNRDNKNASIGIVKFAYEFYK
jgi:hypothetical protein